MAQDSGASSMADILDTPPSPAAATAPVNADDSDEWEYEYSTTETETYYVTLDLTQPGTTQKKPKKTKPVGRVGKNSGWVDPGREQLQVAIPEDAQGPAQGIEDADGDANEANKSKGEEIHMPRINEVQILDIDTPQPVVSYGGKVYACRWEQNIGTELLFIAHNPDDPLPALRSLPQGVDLLAASSARIVSQPVRLEAKENNGSISPILADNDRAAPGFRIPVGPGARSQRKEQGRFLEKIMAVKAKKGEKDAVTVIASRRKSKKQWERFLEDQRKQERNKLARSIKKGGKAAEQAQERLQAMDKEDEQKGHKVTGTLRGRPPKFGREGKPRSGRSKKSVQLARLPTVFEQQQHGYGQPSSTAGTEYGDEMSIPTPQRWSDIEEGAEEDTSMIGGDAAFDDMDDETGPTFQSEELNNGEELYDEDAPGEDDDTLQYEW